MVTEANQERGDSGSILNSSLSFITMKEERIQTNQEMRIIGPPGLASGAGELGGFHDEARAGEWMGGRMIDFLGKDEYKQNWRRDWLDEDRSTG